MSAFDVGERRLAHDGTDRALFYCLAHLEERHCLSVDDLTLTESPTESIRGSLYCDHPKTLIGRVPPRISGHDHLIAHLQGFAGHPRAAQLAGSGPLDVPVHFFAVFVDGGYVNKGVRISKKKLSDFAFNGYSFSGVIRRREGMMGK